MVRYARWRVSVLALLACSLLCADTTAADRNQRKRNQQRSAAARAKALDKAIAAAKTRVKRAEGIANAAATALQKRAAEAGESGYRFQAAINELEHADNEKYGASQELAELRAKIEKFEPDDSPLKKARREYDEALEALAEIRIDIYESDKYQLLYEGAKQSPNEEEELERVTRLCFDEDTDYAAAKQRVERAKLQYNKIRYALYEADPDWAPAAERAKAATIAGNKAATSVKASGAEKGIERANAREAQQRYAVAQSALADAKGDLKRLESQKKKAQATTSASQSNKKNKK